MSFKIIVFFSVYKAMFIWQACLQPFLSLLLSRYRITLTAFCQHRTTTFCPSVSLSKAQL